MTLLLFAVALVIFATGVQIGLFYAVAQIRQQAKESEKDNG